MASNTIELICSLRESRDKGKKLNQYRIEIPEDNEEASWTKIESFLDWWVSLAMEMEVGRSQTV